jgi:hypothetical protein
MKPFEDPGEDYPQWFRNQVYLNWVVREQRPLGYKIRVAISVFLIYILPTIWIGFLTVAVIGTLVKGFQ